jgi:hypothetical protein
VPWRRARGQAPDQRQQQHRVAQVGLDRFGHARVLDLHGHVVAVDRRRTVDLADGGRREGAPIEIGKHVSERRAELLAQELLQAIERHRRDAVAKGGELALQRVLLLVLEAVEVDHRKHLSDLHGRAAHPAELVDELVHQRRGALPLSGLGPLGRPHAVGGAHAGPAHALPGHEPADARRPGDPAGRQLPCLGRRIVRVRPHASRLAGARRLLDLVDDLADACAPPPPPPSSSRARSAARAVPVLLVEQ